MAVSDLHLYCVFKSLQITSVFTFEGLCLVLLLCLTMCLCFSCLSDVEECQLSECGGEEELGSGESPLPRSSSTSDITQQLSDTLPGEYKHKLDFNPPCLTSDLDWNYAPTVVLYRDWWQRKKWFLDASQWTWIYYLFKYMHYNDHFFLNVS